MREMCCKETACVLVWCGVALASCGPSDKVRTAAPTATVLPPVEVVPEPYRPSRERNTDVVHTRLDLRFDRQQEHVSGRAEITAKPYFYALQEVVLDAKGFEIHAVSLSGKKGVTAPAWRYDGKQLAIDLDTTYQRTDTFRITIAYTAKPGEAAEGGSKAISADRGLYFINADGSVANKPTQIWTQGETESNSRWFPAVDAPNERMTQEICLTVDSVFTTLSNGLPAGSVANGDGTRTDCWKQTLPHAPYLAMVAVGEFAVVKDRWRDIAVDYYVEPRYEKVARRIFGNTPEMLEFYSNVLGVDYPWEKYAQIVVRDFVSGAMENTTAVVLGEFVQGNGRKLLDETHEDIIAHELFHHWFGNLVTCESWGNLPLNESFATYGEYLWHEYRYGRDHADSYGRQDLLLYLYEAGEKQANLIRYRYADAGDMFDNHSYQKGGRILHMLRKYTGDEAFFAALNRYLTLHRFSSVEVHDLRLAFEHVTGKDLNWFFDQWFLGKGHPDLEISYRYDADSREQLVVVEQKQHPDTTPLFRLPVAVDLYWGERRERQEIEISRAAQTFRFSAPEKPDLVNVDAEKMLVCTKKDNKLPAEWIFQYRNTPLYLDRYEAVEALGGDTGNAEAKAVLMAALNDRQWDIRVLAIGELGRRVKTDDGAIRHAVMRMSENDVRSAVRAAAVEFMARHFVRDDASRSLFLSALNDSSYYVVSEALRALCHHDTAECLARAGAFEREDDEGMLVSLAFLYARYGRQEHNGFYTALATRMSDYNKENFYAAYGSFLERQNDETVNRGLSVLRDGAMNEKNWEVRHRSAYALIRLLHRYYLRELQIQEALSDSRRMSGSTPGDVFLEKDLSGAIAKQQHIMAILEEVKAHETNDVIVYHIGRELDDMRKHQAGQKN